MLNEIELWIDQTNTEFMNQRHCCDRFTVEFKGFYPVSFLKQAYFVVVDKIPKPDFPELRQLGLGDFLDMDANGVTYKHTYYILPHAAQKLRLHFHELVHVAQWISLGATNFIERYIAEIQSNGYAQAPLEKMAYALDALFSNGGKPIDVPSFASENI